MAVNNEFGDSKKRDTLLCISLGEAAKPLKQCLLTGQNNDSSHLPLVQGSVLKKLLFHVKNL